MEIKDLQEKIKQLKLAKDLYTASKRETEEFKSRVDSLEFEILQHLEENQMTNFRVDGHALVSVVEKMSVKTPKDTESKKAFFNWLKEKHGEEVMNAYMSVNSQSLNSFYKTEFESLSDEEKLNFSIPGIEPATLVKTLSVRKA